MCFLALMTATHGKLEGSTGTAPKIQNKLPTLITHFTFEVRYFLTGNARSRRNRDPKVKRLASVNHASSKNRLSDEPLKEEHAPAVSSYFRGVPLT